MITRRELIERYPAGIATGDAGGVIVAEILEGDPCLWSYSPDSLGLPAQRDELNRLVAVAMLKIGWKADRRCKKGYRRI